MLQEKLNTYLYFIESGKLVETYFWAKGLPVVIQISGKYPMSSEAQRFFLSASISRRNRGSLSSWGAIAAADSTSRAALSASPFRR